MKMAFARVKLWRPVDGASEVITKTILDADINGTRLALAATIAAFPDDNNQMPWSVFSIRRSGDRGMPRW